MTYILYGGRFTRTLIVEMVMAEDDITHEPRVETMREQYAQMQARGESVK